MPRGVFAPSEIFWKQRRRHFRRWRTGTKDPRRSTQPLLIQAVVLLVCGLLVTVQGTDNVSVFADASALPFLFANAHGRRREDPCLGSSGAKGDKMADLYRAEPQCTKQSVAVPCLVRYCCNAPREDDVMLRCQPKLSRPLGTIMWRASITSTFQGFTTHERVHTGVFGPDLGWHLQASAQARTQQPVRIWRRRTLAPATSPDFTSWRRPNAGAGAADMNSMMLIVKARLREGH